MTKDIIKLAQEAGIKNDCDGIWCNADQLRRFANLAVAAEREEIVTALREALAQEHAMHELARLGQEIEQAAEPISTHKAMRDAKLNAGWGSEQQAEPPPEWPLIKNILAEYGLDAISFVAEFKAAQRPWVGLTEEDWGWVADRKGTSLDTFDQGAAWAADQLKERNNG